MMQEIRQFLDYAATHPDAIVNFKASDTIIAGHSNALYLSKLKSQSRVGGHFSMSKNSADPLNNGAVLTIAQIIKAVLSSASKAEIGALYINCRESILARHALIAMGHPQPPTPMQTDNTTVLGVIHNTINPSRIKSMDVRFHWFCDCIQQLQFCHYWRPGHTNKDNYVTKHHAPIHHAAMRSTFLTPKTSLDALRM